jgi:FtsZ-interacting cell division protein ZipA
MIETSCLSRKDTRFTGSSFTFKGKFAFWYFSIDCMIVCAHTFDLNNMDEFTTLGISFFLALPTPINNLDAFEQMLGVAQEIRATLGGDLKDDHRNAMTGQTIEHYRQRIRDFELRRLKAVAARG